MECAVIISVVPLGVSLVPVPTCSTRYPSSPSFAGRSERSGISTLKSIEPGGLTIQPPAS